MTPKIKEYPLRAETVSFFHCGLDLLEITGSVERFHLQLVAFKMSPICEFFVLFPESSRNQNQDQDQELTIKIRDFSNNSLSGTIPSSIGNLSRLVYL